MIIMEIIKDMKKIRYLHIYKREKCEINKEK